MENPENVKKEANIKIIPVKILKARCFTCDTN